MRLVRHHLSFMLLCLTTLDPSLVRGETEAEGELGSSDEGAVDERTASQSGNAEVDLESEASSGTSDSSSRRGAPLSPYGFSGPRPGRIAVSIGGGWPSGWLEVDYGANERLGVGLHIGYLYGLPTGGIQTASAVHIGLPTRLALLRRSSIELTLDIEPGVVVSLDHKLSVVAYDPEDEEDSGIIPADQVRPIGTHLDVGLTLSWSLRQALVLRFGFHLPTTLVLVMTERPYDDTWELALPFAARVGVTWRALRWMGIFAVVDVGPSVVVTPSEWSSEGYERETGVDVFLRASVGITFAPWP